MHAAVRFRRRIAGDPEAKAMGWPEREIAVVLMPADGAAGSGSFVDPLVPPETDLIAQDLPSRLVIPCLPASPLI